jgi:hypothetical protein
LDLSEHELRSLRKWLNAAYPGRDIHLGRPETEFDRPAFVLTQATPRFDTERGRHGGLEIETTWQIEVLGEDVMTTRRETAEIRERLLTSRNVPLYLWSWRYPSPTVEVVPAVGALSAGNVSVIVTAVNHQGEESLGSDPVSVTVAANDAIDVLIPPWPRQSRVAEVFRVFAGAPGTEQLVAEITDLPANAMATVLRVTSLAAGAPPPSSSVSFFYRFMRVLGAETELLEHPSKDGVWNGFVRARMSVLSQRLFDAKYPINDIAIATEVG